MASRPVLGGSAPSGELSRCGVGDSSFEAYPSSSADSSVFAASSAFAPRDQRDGRLVDASLALRSPRERFMCACAAMVASSCSPKTFESIGYCAACSFTKSIPARVITAIDLTVRAAREPARAAREARAAEPCVTIWRKPWPKSDDMRSMKSGTKKSITRVAIRSRTKRTESAYPHFSSLTLITMSKMKKTNTASVAQPTATSCSAARSSKQRSLPISAKNIDATDSAEYT